MPRHPHILNAASNLLGIALLIITGLHVARFAEKTFADEIAWGAALAFSSSCLLSYGGLRSEGASPALDRWADRVFILGLFALVLSVVTLALF